MTLGNLIKIYIGSCYFRLCSRKEKAWLLAIHCKVIYIWFAILISRHLMEKLYLAVFSPISS